RRLVVAHVHLRSRHKPGGNRREPRTGPVDRTERRGVLAGVGDPPHRRPCRREPRSRHRRRADAASPRQARERRQALGPDRSVAKPVDRTIPCGSYSADFSKGDSSMRHRDRTLRAAVITIAVLAGVSAASTVASAGGAPAPKVLLRDNQASVDNTTQFQNTTAPYPPYQHSTNVEPSIAV